MNTHAVGDSLESSISQTTKDVGIVDEAGAQQTLRCLFALRVPRRVNCANVNKIQLSAVATVG